MSLPSIFDYLPESSDLLVKHAAKKEEPVVMSPEVAKAALKALTATAIGGGLGYAGGKLVARKFGPYIPPGAVGATGALLSGAIAGAQLAHDKKLMEVLRRADEDRKNRTARRSS